MYKVLIAAGALCSVAVPAGSQTSAEPPQARPTPPAISAARLQVLRQQLQTQVAVYEAAEKAMRSPTAEESKALAGNAGEAAGRVVALPGGGVAMRGDPSQASFLVVETGTDGKVVIGHGSPASARVATPPQGGARDAR